MMAVDSLRIIVPSGVLPCWLSPCHRVCSADASALHLAQPTALPSHVQVSCLERARPMVMVAFVGGLAEGRTASPGRRRSERKRGAKAEGKIKCRGTQPLENLVCTWGWRGTRQGASACRESDRCRIGTGESACFARLAVLALDGGTS